MASIGQSITIIPSVESTNNYAMAEIHAGLAKHANSYLALEQTGGKGQRGKSWHSRPGENITMSVVLAPKRLALANQFVLNMGVALACFDLMNKYAGGETRIKWPNDIYLGDRKTGGILIESTVQGSAWHWAIAGIGLNINQVVFPEHLPNPVSLSMITGQPYDIFLLAKELCQGVQERFGQAQAGAASTLLNDYNKHLYKRGEMVTLKRDNHSVETLVHGVNEQGRLLTSEGVFATGEVEWVR